MPWLRTRLCVTATPRARYPSLEMLEQEILFCSELIPKIEHN
jgi:hypothetical protein